MDNLLLLSGQSIPLYELNLIINQPKLKDVAAVGEDRFFSGISLFNMKKEDFKESLPEDLYESITNYDCFLMVVNHNKEYQQQVTEVLSIFFPSYEVAILADGMIFTIEGTNVEISKEQFEMLSKHMYKICIPNSVSMKEQEYKVESSAAARIKEKLEKGKKKAEEINRRKKGQSGEGKTSISPLVSSLAIATGLSLNEVFEYTIIQFYDQLFRHQHREQYQASLQAIMAGAKEVEIKSWYEEI